jgi:hypothetical protein
MPSNTVYVGRPSKWGNPYRLNDVRWGYIKTAAEAVERYRQLMENTKHEWGFDEDLAPLRGKDLACWCPVDQPCHADVLLELANQPLQDDKESK